MNTFQINEIIAIIVIAISTTGMSILWRNCIYTRGAIFRPIGRILDRWVYKGINVNNIWWKVLRFIAYPLGRCIYCSSFHLTYILFSIINTLFDLELSYNYLFILIPLVHLMVIVSMKYWINNNDDMEEDDWWYFGDNEFKYGELWDFQTKNAPKNYEFNLSINKPRIIDDHSINLYDLHNLKIPILTDSKFEVKTPLSKDDEKDLETAKSG